MRRAIAAGGRRLRWAGGGPARFARRRISAQLIGAHLLVVLLTVLVLGAAIVATVLGWLPAGTVGYQETYADFALGEKARTVSVVVGPDTIAAAGAGAIGSNDALAAALRGVIDEGWASAPGADGRPRSLGGTLPGVTRALVAAPDGTVLASSDAAWAEPGAPVEAVPEPNVAAVTRETIANDGRFVEEYGDAWIVDDAAESGVGSYPVMLGDRLVGVVTLQGARLKLDGPARDEVAREVATAVAVAVPLLAMPALLVAIPVGVWRARTVSRRLARLAAAADAMARGDLTRRVPRVGEDEIGRLGERFNYMIERLAEADRSRKRFVANVSHELRTPVAVIQGHAERLLAQPAPGTVAAGSATAPTSPAPTRDPDETAALAVIHRETVTLGRLIDDLFTLARLDEATLPVEPAPVRLDDIAAEATAGLRALAWDGRKVTIRSLIGPDLPPALADRTRVRQILNNLLHNALRHTPEGGVIMVDAAAEGHPDAITVSVTDTGVGIPTADLAGIFDRYVRGDDGGGRDGSGLGLHIVKQLVEAQGGTIAAESATGRGSTFRFTLPRAG